MHMLINKKI